MRELPEIAYTHAGRFHADDVFSAALLKILKPDIVIRRVPQLPEDFSGFAIDIGWGEFDHHQTGAPVRSNGVPYAAFGLLWREFGTTILSAGEAARLDERLIQPIDLDDNTGCGGVLSDMIADFNPCWDSGQDADQRFDQAVELARQILQNRLDNVLAIGRAYKVVRAALNRMEDNVVVLDTYCPWKPFLPKTRAKFVVYPSQRGGWGAQCVPFHDSKGTLKCPFPQAWAGKSPEELSALTGLATVRFCHKSLFLVAAETREDARAVCLLAQKEAEEKEG